MNNQTLGFNVRKRATGAHGSSNQPRPTESVGWIARKRTTQTLGFIVSPGVPE
jgi:hypothetical protein